MRSPFRLPMRVCPSDSYILQDAAGNRVAETDSITDGKFIVVACNVHWELLTALQIHHDWCAKYQPGYSETGGDAVAYRATKAAIAKATLISGGL